MEQMMDLALAPAGLGLGARGLLLQRCATLRGPRGHELSLHRSWRRRGVP